MDNTQEQPATTPAPYLWRQMDLHATDAVSDIRSRADQLRREVEQKRGLARNSQHAADEATDEADHLYKLLKEYESILARLERP